MGALRIIPGWLFWPKLTYSSTAGFAVATAGPPRGAVESLEEALAVWTQRQKIRLVGADSGFFDDQLLSFLEQRLVPYIVIARRTPWIKHEAQHVEQWRALDEAYAVGEFRLKLPGWQTERRFVVIREVVREGRDSVGRKLIPGSGFKGVPDGGSGDCACGPGATDQSDRHPTRDTRYRRAVGRRR